MLTQRWPPSADAEEYALAFDEGRQRRLLVLPALFDEGNKLRHFTVEVMRRLDRAGIDCFLPDLPGMNESLAPLGAQSLEPWRAAAKAAAVHFGATHVLALRGGAMLDPGDLPGFRYAPVSGRSVLRAQLRARVLAEREAGRDVTSEQLLDAGRRHGIALAGHSLAAAMVRELHETPLPESCATDIAQADLGGGGLWLRAEPAHDPAQADRLAQIVAERLE